jgi:hypothetical protein
MRFLAPSVLALAAAVSPVCAQDSTARLLDSVLTANSRTLHISHGVLAGEGAAFLLDEASRAQFLALGEQHNAMEIPQVTSALFHALQRSAGYQYLADEQDPVALRWVSAFVGPGIHDSVIAYAQRHPHAFTFMSDQELGMLADIAGSSTGKGNHLWGCDQAFGTTHVLDQLIPSLPAGDSRTEATRLRDWARDRERVRDLSRYHFMANEPKTDSFARLAGLVAAAPGSEGAFLVQTLVISDRIYRNYLEGHYYENGYEREEYMKQRFLDEYRRALAADGRPPKVILKFGHWHVYRGLGPSNLQTLGDFVSQFAIADDSRSFQVAIFPEGEPGGYGDLHSWSDHTPLLLAGAASRSQWTIVDLRPLRALYRRIATNLNPEDRDALRRWIFGFDAALFIGGMHRGTYAQNPGVAY